MRRPLATLLLSGLFLAIGLVVAPPASACSCAGGTTQEFLDRADAVFTGRLVSRESVGAGDAALHVFAVDTVVKGTAREQQGVLSPDSGASCGLELSGDGPFVVFATRSAELGGAPFATPGNGQYAAFLCGGTAPLTPALEAQLEALVPATESPLPGAPGRTSAGAGPPWPATAGVAALALAVGLGAAVLRRRGSGPERVRPGAPG